jgi:plasmid stabilization system protein ParE
MRSIAAYVGASRPAAAKRVISKLRETFEQLAASPQIGTACTHVGDGMRHFTPNGPARRYVIIFRSLSEQLGVEIVAVVDGSRNWEFFLRTPD